MPGSLMRFVPALIVAGVGSIVLWMATDGLAAFTTEAARRLNVTRANVDIPKVTLTNATGAQLSLHDGKITLVEFIYTTCPTICQMAGADFFRLQERLRKLGLSAHVKMLSVSFDPVHDDNASLASYADYHGADGKIWAVARPRVEALPTILRSFGITVIRDEYGGYQHNTAIHVLDRNGRLVAITDTDDVEETTTIIESLM